MLSCDVTLRGLPRGEQRGDLRGDPRGDPRGDLRGDPRGDLRGSPRGDPRGSLRGELADRSLIFPRRERGLGQGEEFLDGSVPNINCISYETSERRSFTLVK